MWKHRGLRIAKATLSKKSKTGDTQYLILRHTAEPLQQRQHSTDIRTDTQTNGDIETNPSTERPQ